MSELYDQIVGQRGSFERLLARVPGFRGYLDRASRRTADTMLRDYVADQLQMQVNNLTQVERQLVDNGGMEYLSETASAKTKLQTFIDRVRAAAPGYSGFMEAVKVEADELERLYSFDEAQIQYVDQFDEAIQSLRNAVQSNEGIPAAIAELDRVAVGANQAYTLREDVLTNLSKTLPAR